MKNNKVIMVDNDGKKKLGIFDFDGTITRKSLVLSHGIFLEKHGIIHTNGIGSNWENDMKNEHLIFELAVKYQSEITGKNVNDLMIKEFITEFINEENIFYPRALEILDNVESLIISGSADFLIQEFVKQYGKNIRAIGTIYETKNDIITGKLKPMFNAESKKEFISNLDLFKYDTVIGLGDTLSDEFIFSNADYRILVEPTIETLKGYSLKGIVFNEII